jgi:hypothetical protein
MTTMCLIGVAVGSLWLCERELFVEWVLLAAAAIAVSATTAASKTRTSESFFNGLSFLGSGFGTYTPPIPPSSVPMIFLCSGVGKLELPAMMDFQIASLSPLSPAWRPPGSGPFYNHLVTSILKPSSSPSWASSRMCT